MPADGAKPNLIFVFADQLRSSSCGYAGDVRARTPHIDAFAREGVDFCNAVSGHPVCAPYRASLFTGKYSSSTGMVINELRMNPNHECIGHMLHRAGYQTDYIGKWHLWADNSRHSDMANHFVPRGPYRLGFDGYWATNNFYHQYYKAFYFEDEPVRIDIDGYEPDVQTDMAIDRISKHTEADEAFAMFLSYGTPHDAWVRDNVPDQYAAIFDPADFPLPANYEDGSAEYWQPSLNREWWMTRIKPRLPEMQALYSAMTANLDHNFGRLLRAIDESGQRDNTIVVFTSDHGEMFGAHGRVAKLIFYDEAARVPFLIRWPGNIRPGSLSDVPLNTPDIMPTLLGLLGLESSSGVEGTDLSRSALGLPGSEPEFAFMQGMGHTFMWEDGFEWRALRGRQHTYAVTLRDRAEYLFNNVEDPLQIHNLAADPQHANLLSDLRAELRRRMADLGDEFRPCTWYRDHWTRDRHIIRSATLNR